MQRLAVGSKNKKLNDILRRMGINAKIFSFFSFLVIIFLGHCKRVRKRETKRIRRVQSTSWRSLVAYLSMYKQVSPDRSFYFIFTDFLFQQRWSSRLFDFLWSMTTMPILPTINPTKQRHQQCRKRKWSRKKRK